MRKIDQLTTLIKIILVIVCFNSALTSYAQKTLPKYRWGKHSAISRTSKTLDGVKPLAKWIWDSGDENPKNYYLLVRKTFDLPDAPSEAITYISAFAYADVYINGRLFERCPVNSDPEYQNYDKFNIAGYLQKGKNTITAVVQNFGVGLHSQMNARGGFFFQSKINYSGKSINLLSDNTWKVTRAKAWDNETAYRDANAHLIGFIEKFDARLWPQGWEEPDFDDAGWENATIIGVPPVKPWNGISVIERPQLVRKTVKPLKHWTSGNKVVYDFGTEIVGYPQFTINAKAGGSQFEIGTGERLDSAGAPLLRVSSDHSEKYITRKGLQSWRPYTWSGFRYFSIETDKDVEILNADAEFACYDYEMQSSFECSDPELNRFWEIGRHTMRINSIDTYEDPWREHTQYIAGDSRYMQIFGNYAFGKSSRLLSAYNLLSGAQSQRWRSDGAVRSRYPTDYFLQPGSSAYLADYQLEWVLMMQLIRFVSSHEVGHTLGLQHNFLASNFTPVDSLRSQRYLEKHGHTISIMDYARFNYVAQPEDHIRQEQLWPRIGEYDHWAIKWGYGPAKTDDAEEERLELSKMVTARLNRSPQLLYVSTQEVLEIGVDPRAKAEDLGDDVIKANTYGIKNLKRVAAGLPKWTYVEGGDQSDLKSAYTELQTEYYRFVKHVLNYIQGVYYTPKNNEQAGAVYAEIPKAKRLEALRFFDKEVFTSPVWLMNPQILEKIDLPSEPNFIEDTQVKLLNTLLDNTLLNSLSAHVFSYGNKALSLEQYVSIIHNSIWKEVKAGVPVTDPYRRNLQRSYLQCLLTILVSKDSKAMETEIAPLVRADVYLIQKEIKQALRKTKDSTTLSHLRDLRERLDSILNSNNKLS